MSIDKSCSQVRRIVHRLINNNAIQTEAVGNGKSTDSLGAAAEDKGSPTAADLAGIHLPGQEDDSVEVYDPCDKLRKWINAYMKKPGVTQAQFCHDQPTMYSGGTKVADALLNTFRNEKSLTTGNTCPILCAGYVFVENLRLKEN
ncbi:hypothetical protein MPH_12619 [Macrophomina phaseolina MS6]|uniref:Uncharacterized protein n=1 Tax=Macrophomina phaseolina (strain MS6) TaxID=1126212 RepID=K2R7L6_MACPH|nr:hypothetical protein MPH_12619 [Macrophomina phaseolina MS6]